MQLRIHSDLTAEYRHIKMGKESNFTFPCQPFPQASTAQHRERTPQLTDTFPWGRWKEKSIVCIRFSSFREGCLRITLVPVSPLLECLQDWHSWGATENKEEWRVACCSIIACHSWEKVHNLGYIPWEGGRGKTAVLLFRALPEYWQSYRRIVTLIHCWWEGELEHSLIYQMNQII